MKHIHFDECSSTQNYLKDYLDNPESKDDSEILISTELQTLGRGRQGNKWLHLDNSLALSFTVEVKEQVTLIPLEVGFLISNYLSTKFKKEVLLKWPNDLLNLDGHKIGGIICQLINPNLAICGVGINLGQSKSNQIERVQFPIGNLINKFIIPKKEYEILPSEIYQYILQNRISNSELRESWQKKCFHNNTEVRVVDNNTNSVGRFVGIGEFGEALIQNDKEIEKVFSGSLLLT